uniref:LPS-responsive vesicle trafficking, beach and anchor containing n=1 Tax=Poecilia mexicana TaxID=48701 RepID=A0A3B3WP50_9TELE
MASAESAEPGDGKDGRAGAMQLNPAVPIRGIRMKFAVLAGLVEVGEVSNRDIVETVFNLLVGGQFDLEMNFIIQEPESIVCMVELLDKCEPTCQAEIWSIFTAILKKSVRNLQACTEVELIQLVLHRISTTDSMIAGMGENVLLFVIATFSLSLFGTLSLNLLNLFKMQMNKKYSPRHAVKLLSVLKYMAHRNGPDSFFSFPGKNAAAIALPPIARWPYQNGFTFHTWIRMDPLNNINVDKDKPYLYCFRTSKGMGYSAHFVAGCLIVTSLKSNGKGFQHCVKYDFKPQKWYMVTLVHIYNRWKNSEISCFVNGELASYGDIAWFVNTSDTFDKCFLGSSETADVNRVFCGQMGAVYLFAEALSAAQILAIYQLGPGYQGTFKHRAESDLLFAEHHKTLLYDGKLASSIAFTYNPCATDAQLCLESSPKDNASIFVHSPHALMLQDVKAVVTHSVQSGIHSIGGVQVLFPLFAQLDYWQPSSQEPDTSVCSCTLLSFMMELLKNSVAMQEQVLACKGFLVIGYTLEKSSKVHVTRPVLDIVLTFSRYLSNLQNGIYLLKQLCDHILFNPAIWIHAPPKVQLMLYTYLATEFISTVTIYNAVRRVGTVLQVMHTLKYFYWVVNPHDRSGVIPKGVDGPRPNQKEMLSLRAFLLLFIKQLIMKDHGVKEDELQSILNYLLTMHEDENLMDVLQLLVALMSEHPGTMVQAFDQRNGIRVIYKLLASKNEGIRVQALKVMGYFLKSLSAKRKSEVMLTHGLFSLLTERLMLHSNPFTMTTYNTLFEILMEQICTQVIHKQHPDPDSSVKIVNPQILKVIAALLKNCPQSPESMEVRRVFLSDMIKLFNNSRENRRSLLQCSVWQEWMLSLCFVSPRSNEEQKITEMVYAVFRILLYHAIKYEWGGWRVWVDTLSITHSKVTFEQHKESLSRMFRQYQDQGSTSSRSTVRTISGVSQISEDTKSVNGSPAEETAPSTVVQLTVDEGSSSTITSTPVEAAEDRNQPSITVSNILAGAEEEQKMELSSGDQSNVDKETSTAVHRDEVTEPASEKSSHDAETSGNAQSEASGPKTEEDSAAPTKDDAQAEVAHHEQGDSLEHSTEESSVTSEKGDDSKQMSSEPPAPLENSVVGGASIFNEDLVDVSSVSDQINPSDVDDSQEESSYASAATGEEGEPVKKEDDKHEGDGSKTKDLRKQEPKTEEGKQETETVIREEEEEKDSVENQVSCLEEIKIARLDVANVAVDTERLELKETSITVRIYSLIRTLESMFLNPARWLKFCLVGVTLQESNQGQTTTAAGAAGEAGEAGSPAGRPEDGSTSAPRSTMFRIPEFRWSHMHQRLLTDLLFSIETDVQAWRSHSTKTVLDFVNSSENAVFVHNSIHLVSQVVDNLIMACGGILPLLSAATSASHELENIEPSQGLSVEASITFLQRLINLADVLIFASSLNFTEIEAEKNMSSGGILRQCLRLVCAIAVRNCLECQQAQCVITDSLSFTQSPVDAVTGGMSTVRDLDRLLQDMDINRLRAVVFRDIEDSKQAQFLALAVVYFISVLMVSKYRDILEPHNDRKPPLRSQSARSTGTQRVASAAYSSAEVENGVSLRRYDSGIGDDHTSAVAGEADLSSSGGPDAVSEALSTLSSEVRGAPFADSKSKNVKDILRSLVSAPAEDVMVDPSLLPLSFLGPVTDLDRRSSLQFRSFDRSVVVAPKKAGVLPSQVSPAAAQTSAATSVSAGTPVDGVAVVSSGDASQAPSVDAVDCNISERLEHALEKAAPLLREIFVDFAPFLSRTLLGSHGQELLIEGTSLVCMKSSSSVVELVMLLCSQEWQNSIQKNAGLAFIELVNEGRLLSHTMKDHLVRVANEAEFILSRQRAEDIHKHAEFESNCAQYAAEKRDEEKMCDHLIRAAKFRDHMTSTQLIQKIVNILTDKHGAWGSSSVSWPREFWRLDYWEDDLRRRRRFIRNPFGSSHSEAALKAAAEHASEDDILKQSIRSQALANRNTESETSLDGDDDTLSSLEDKDLENLTGPVNLSTSAQLIAPAAVVKGTLSVTASELFFEVDEDDPSFKDIDPKVRRALCLHRPARLVPVRLPRVFLALVQQQGLHVVVVERLARQLQVPVPQSLQDRQTLLPAAAHEQPVLGLAELQHPCVALRRALLPRQRVALFGQEVEALRLDLGHPVRSGPGDVRHGPLRRASGPDARALEGRGDLHHVPLPDPQLDLAGVGHHLHHVSVAALVHGLRHQSLEPGADLSGREVARGGDELYPQRHAPLAAVAQLQHRAAG